MMAVNARKVKNKRNAAGVHTGLAGTVYDVNVKYRVDDKRKQYVKKGFLTKTDALEHEAEMKVELRTSAYVVAAAMQRNQTVEEYLETWVEHHGRANLKPMAFDEYKRCIRNHIVPVIGHVRLRSVTPAMLDYLFQKMFDKGLPNNSVHNAQCILNLAFEAARKYYFVETNPTRDIHTKFGKGGKTSAPYTIMSKEME